MPTAKSIKVALALTKKEGTFGTAIADAALTDMLKMTEIDFAETETDYETDADEITGFAGPTEHEVQSRRGTVPRKAKASVEAIAAYLIWALGRVTSSGAGPFTHTVQWPLICTLNPVSFSFIEGLDCAGSTGTFWLYKGDVVDQIVIEFNRKGAGTLTLNLRTDGSETAKPSFVFPASYTAVNKLLFSNLTFKLGPDLAPGSANLTSILRSIKITINCGIQEPDSPGAGVNVSEYQFGENNPDLQIEFVVKADKSHAVYGHYQNNTNVKLQVLMQKSAAASVQLDCSEGIVKAKQTRQGLEPRLSITYMPEWNSTDGGPGKWTIINGNATYLTAA